MKKIVSVLFALLAALLLSGCADFLIVSMMCQSKPEMCGFSPSPMSKQKLGVYESP